MPTTSFIQMCMHHFGRRNQENYDQLCQDVEGEGEDDLVVTGEGRRGDIIDGSTNIAPSTMTCPPAVDGVDDEHAADDSIEWEFGIRRAKSAVGKNIEDITMSDIVLDPDGSFTYYWLGIMTMSVIYNIIVVILRVAFEEMRDPVIQDSIFYVFDTICDLVYIVDIVIHSRVSFYDDGCLVLDPDRIKERYQTSRKFKMDIISIVPYHTVFSLLLGTCGFFYADSLSWFPGDFYIMLVRFPRLLKYPTMAKFFDLTDSRTRNPNLIRAFKLTLNLWVVIHWIGCIYYVLSEYEGLGSNSWVYPSDEEYQYFSRKYVRVTYWSLMTLTTIGERPPPETDLEYVFTGLTFLIGVFVFAAVVGNVGDVISNMNAARTEFQSRMDQLKLYMQHRHVDDNLQNKVKRWADYTWKRSSVDEPSLLQLLPDRLRTEIAINVHLDTLKEVEMFKKCEEGLLRELVLKLRPQTYSPGDYICRIGEIGREMYIVNHGRVEISIPKGPSNIPSVIAKLTRGKYFGEISLLKMDDGQNRRTADVKAVGYAELLRLSRRDLMSALIEYPNAKRILEEIARERVVNTKKEFIGPRKMSTIDDTHSEMSGRQPTKLTRIIQSKGFQQLLADRTKEQNELFRIINELKHFDSQNTKSLMESLMEENKTLRTELAQKSKENSVLKQQIKGKRKSRKTSASSTLTSQASGKLGHKICNNDQEACQSSDDDTSDLTSIDSTRKRKLISKDSAYTSSDISPEFISGQNSDILTVINDITEDFDDRVRHVPPKITLIPESPAERSTMQTKKSDTCCHKCTSKSDTHSSSTGHESKCSCFQLEHANCSDSNLLESSTMDTNKNFSFSSHSNSTKASSINDVNTTGNQAAISQNVSMKETHTCTNNNMPTREVSEQELVCELISKELDLHHGVCTDDNEGINTLPNIKCLQQLLSVADDYQTDNSLRSADDSSDDVSDYD